MKIYKTKYFYPFVVKNNKLKPNLRILSKQGASGIYFIRSEKTKAIVYVGYSGTNLHRTLYRHFYKWTDKQQERKVFKKSGYKVRIMFTTPAQAARLEKYFIQKLKPIYNNFQYEADLIDQPKLDDYLKGADIITLNPAENTNDPF